MRFEYQIVGLCSDLRDQGTFLLPKLELPTWASRLPTSRLLLFQISRFCEIWVPLPIIRGVSTNLYELTNVSTITCEKQSWLYKKIKYYEKKKNTFYQVETLVLRYFNVFGPRQHPEKLVPKVIQLASQDCKIPVYGSGMQVRDWLYVKDHCQAILDIILKGEVGQIYNIAGRNEINNLEMIDSILRRIGKSSELIEHTNDRQGHDFRYSVDDGKLRSLGWEPRISFEDGLDYTIEDTINRLGLGKK